MGRLIAREERLRLGKRGKSDLILQMWFGDFNKPFKPARTAFDWLSRDEKEVDAFVADPLCGFPFTTQLAIDVLDALPHVTSRESLAAIRKDLPIYVFSGERDPVGANIKGLIQDLKAAGFTRAHDPHLSGRPARDAERVEPRRGDARLHRLARRDRASEINAQ